MDEVKTAVVRLLDNILKANIHLIIGYNLYPGWDTYDHLFAQDIGDKVTKLHFLRM